MPRWATIFQARIPRKQVPPSVARQLRVLYAKGPFEDPQELHHALMVDSYLSSPGGVASEKNRAFFLDEYLSTPGGEASEKVLTYFADDDPSPPHGYEGARARAIQINGDDDVTVGPEPTITEGTHDGTDITLTIESVNTLLPEPDKYNIYRSQTKGGSYTKIDEITNPSDTETYTDTNVNSGQFYYYVATTTSPSGVEGRFSNEVAMKIGAVEAIVNIRKEENNVALSNFPVYVDLSDMPDYWWENVANDGSDIRVFNQSDTGVPREVVWIDTANRQGALYFEADQIDDINDSPFAVECGTGNAAPAPSDPLGRNNVWANGYHRVYHFAGDPSSGTLLDSTGNADGSVNGGMTAGDLQQGVGLTGSRWDFDGADDYVRLPISYGWGGGNDWTFHVVFEADVQPPTHFDLLKADAEADQPARLDDDLTFQVLDEDATLDGFTYGTGAPEMGSITYDDSAGETRVFGNGRPDNATTNINWDAGGDIDVMRQFSGEWGDGKVEQILIETVERSDSWIDARWRNLRRTDRYYEILTS